MNLSIPEKLHKAVVVRESVYSCLFAKNVFMNACASEIDKG